ncbi:MAG: A/G-specific adenine glycosylase [Pseudomonadota bacterium]|nr:A/G-specific adenine glycosylase [Pseudomonadota bacterium]
MQANAAQRLIQHYVDNFRHLPWRSPPGSAPPEPYRVWLSEVMLQQTTVAAVTPRFERFVARWPTTEALATALDEDILSEWAGLGYYARARNLIACAREVAARGGFPETEEELRKLPGVGAYTAAAIAAIAFGKRAIVVDTNVARVVARLNALDRLVRSSAARLHALTDRLTPATGAGEFAQAMMDLGATICRPRQPLCGKCPLQPDCAAFASGDPERFPPTPEKRARPVRHGTAWWTERDGCVWLVRRPTRGMLGGMPALPGGEWDADAPPVGEPITLVRFDFTHFRLFLSVVKCATPTGEGWWQPIGTFAEAGLPTLYVRAIEQVIGGRSRLAA